MMFACDGAMMTDRVAAFRCVCVCVEGWKKNTRAHAPSMQILIHCETEDFIVLISG